MTTFLPFKLTATEISHKVASGEFQARDIAAFYIDRNERYAKDLNTNLFFDQADVEAQVRGLEQRLNEGEKPRLAGVPVLVKDNICTNGMPTTCASKILVNFRPPYDAHVVEQLKKAGAIIFGKTNCDEFAMGSSNENSAFGTVKNPWDKSRVPGGSSGGSAAAVAADLAPLALGSDTGGSIRQPASLCGIVGLKPTYGAVSRYGLIAFGSSLDQIGPFARNVTDAALLTDVISGHDRRDSTSADRPATKLQAALLQDIKVKPPKIGLVKEFFGDGMDADTKAALLKALDVYRSLGATVVDVSLPYLKYSISAYYLLATAEASANLARYDGIKFGQRAAGTNLSLKDMYRKTRGQGFGREVKQRIMLGTFALSSGYYEAYYAQANRARYLIAQDFAKAFEQCDLLVSPTSPTTAFKIGEKSQDPLAMYLSDICTIGINLAGTPGISIPCGFDRQRLPIGMQLMAPRFGEEQLLRGAYLYEQATRWNEQAQPNL